MPVGSPFCRGIPCCDAQLLRLGRGGAAVACYGCTSNAPTSHKPNGDPQSDLKAAVPLFFGGALLIVGLPFKRPDVANPAAGLRA